MHVVHYVAREVAHSMEGLSPADVHVHMSTRAARAVIAVRDACGNESETLIGGSLSSFGFIYIYC